MSLHPLYRRTEVAIQLGSYKHYIIPIAFKTMLNEINEEDAVGQACEFALLSIRNKIVPPIDAINSHESLEVFLGTLSGIIAGWGMVLAERDKKLYEKLLTSLEQMSLGYGRTRGRGLQ